MNWKILFSTARTSIFSPRLVMNVLIGAAIAWGAYLITAGLLQDPVTQANLPAWGVALIPALIPKLFWLTVVVSAISLAFASLKSALPAVLALLLVAPLYLLGYEFVAKVTLFLANAAIILYIIGFVFHGGNIRVAKHR